MSVFNTFGVNRGQQQNGDLQVTFGTLDLATIQTQGTSLATDSTNLTAESGSLTAAMTLGATITSAEMTIIGSLATTAANIAAESGSISTAAGTVTNQIFVAVNAGAGVTNLNVRESLKLIEMYLLSGAPVGQVNLPIL
jgi:hypothetical protein